MSISERLQMVIKMNGMSNSTFADEIGVQRSSISHVIAGRNKPSIDFIQKILDTFPKVDANWLVTGKKVGKTSNDLSNETHEKIERKLPVRSNKTLQTEDPSTTQSSENTPKETKSDINKKIDKVIVFYTDGSFEELTNNS